MNNIKGIIVEIYKSKAVILTSTGEFVNVIATRDMNIGDEYTKTTTINFIKKTSKGLVAALAMFTLLGGGLSAYYIPVATLNLHINPSVQLKTNLFNKVIYSNALNSDGKVILDNINVKNKNFNEALSLIVTESENEKFITEEYKTNKSISLEVTGKNLDVSAFENTVKNHGISIEVKINNKKDSINNNKETNNKNNLVNPNKDFKKSNTQNNFNNDKNKNSLENINSNLNIEDPSQPTDKSSVKESNNKQSDIKNKENDKTNNNKNTKDTNGKKNNILNSKKKHKNFPNNKTLRNQK